MALDMSPRAVAARRRKFEIGRENVPGFFDKDGWPISHEEMEERKRRRREQEEREKKAKPR